MLIQRMLSRIILINVEKNLKSTISHPLRDIAGMHMPVTRRGVVLTIEYCVDFKI